MTKYSLLSLLGIILGILGDIYMFYLFYQSNNREKIEKELSQVNHQYEIEKIRYEELQKNQEDFVKIRHDFQNYILMMRNIES